VKNKFPSTKHQTNAKFQCPKRRNGKLRPIALPWVGNADLRSLQKKIQIVFVLDIGIWNLEFIWNLGFEIWGFSFLAINRPPYTLNRFRLPETKPLV
jgi:hypothetical protein